VLKIGPCESYLNFRRSGYIDHFMNKTLAATLITIIILASTTIVQGQIEVGVKEGDWIEYTVKTTGDAPVEHNIIWARMEILDIKGTEFHANVTSEFPNGTLFSLIRTFNFVEGQVQAWVIIPANLGPGATFYDASINRNVTIEGEEQLTYAGATRTITYINTPEKHKQWDKATGVFVKTQDTFENYTILATANATNMWSPQIFGLDRPVFYAVVTVIVIVVVAVLVSTVLIGRRRKR
jgi:hypothetical protein